MELYIRIPQRGLNAFWWLLKLKLKVVWKIYTTEIKWTKKCENKNCLDSYLQEAYWEHWKIQT